jgi:hypothetical protein
MEFQVILHFAIIIKPIIIPIILGSIIIQEVFLMFSFKVFLIKMHFITILMPIIKLISLRLMINLFIPM